MGGIRKIGILRRWRGTPVGHLFALYAAGAVVVSILMAWIFRDQAGPLCVLIGLFTAGMCGLIGILWWQHLRCKPRIPGDPILKSPPPRGGGDFRHFRHPHRFSTFTGFSVECPFSGVKGPAYLGPFQRTRPDAQWIPCISEAALKEGHLVEVGRRANRVDGQLPEQLRQIHPEMSEQEIQGLVEQRTREVEVLTPPLPTLMKTAWPAHCGDAMEFVMEASRADLKEMAEDGDDFTFFTSHLSVKRPPMSSTMKILMPVFLLCVGAYGAALLLPVILHGFGPDITDFFRVTLGVMFLWLSVMGLSSMMMSQASRAKRLWRNLRKESGLVSWNDTTFVALIFRCHHCAEHLILCEDVFGPWAFFWPLGQKRR
jgi:hypothetical protein